MDNWSLVSECTQRCLQQRGAHVRLQIADVRLQQELRQATVAIGHDTNQLNNVGMVAKWRKQNVHLVSHLLQNVQVLWGPRLNAVQCHIPQCVILLPTSTNAIKAS